MSPPPLPSKPKPDVAPCLYHDDPSDCSGSYPPPGPPPPSSSPSSDGRGTFITALIIAGPVLFVLIICLSLLLFVLRRRRRRQREALLEAALVAPAAPAAPPDDDIEEEEAEHGEVLHHAWHIRTVGLDEASIESIALTRYRAGPAAASDCAVCLGEFADGELLRLLPRCAHAFHVRCIDTWLRAHVNCPLCRSHVLGPASPAAQHSDSPAGAEADAGRAASSNLTTEEMDREASEQRELRLQIDEHDARSTSPVQQPRRHTGPRGGSFRRVVSMDLPSSPIALAEEADPEAGDQVGGEKQGTGGAVHCELTSPGCSGHLKRHRGMERSLSVDSRWALVSRHCRRSSSLLPL